jgi:hypothetical protein
MNRREFLKLLGQSGAALAVAPGGLLPTLEWLLGGSPANSAGHTPISPPLDSDWQINTEAITMIRHSGWNEIDAHGDGVSFQTLYSYLKEEWEDERAKHG